MPWPVTLRRPLSPTWVAPGARNSSTSRFQLSASPTTSPLTRCSMAPASVTFSMLMPSLIGIGGRGGAQVAHIVRADDVETFAAHPAQVRRVFFSGEFLRQLFRDDGVLGHALLLLSGISPQLPIADG